jgi:hypothetical protein
VTRSIFVLASHFDEVETSCLAFPAGDPTHPTRMISSHNRVRNILLGLLFTASSQAIAAGNGPASETVSDNLSRIATAANKNASIPAPSVNAEKLATAPEAPAISVVITTERLAIKARPESASASISITTEPLHVQAVAQK